MGFNPGTRRLPSDVTRDPWTDDRPLSLINQMTLSYFRIVSFSFDLVFQQFLASFSFLIKNRVGGEVSESEIRNWWKWKRIQTMEITLIRGLSGSGKSTLADDIEKKLKVSNLSMSHTQWVIKKKRVKVQKISADFYFTDQNGNYKWDGKKLKVSLFILIF